VRLRRLRSLRTGPRAVAALRTADVLVEVHDHLDPTITPTLRARFEQTHDIEYVPSVPKDPRRIPELAFLTPRTGIGR
jgi:hypothetical protein